MTADLAINGLSWGFIVIGSAFVVIGALGMLRLPDVYTRLHAVSLIETIGGGAILIGLMLQAGLTLVTLKLAMILLIFIFTAPVATHAVAQAALHQEVQPKLASDRRPKGPAAKSQERA